MSTAVRPEYPRPQLRRAAWANLNGPWQFAYDDADQGVCEGWFGISRTALAAGEVFDREITVPFCFQAGLSGIGERGRHDVVWYARRFEDPRTDAEQRLLLHFGAVDYRATVWVNGHRVADHEGGHTPFSADVADAMRPGENTLVVRVEDPLDDLAMPRGKQYWRERGENIFYTPTTGIWQTVWLEPVDRKRVTRLRLTPDLANASVALEVSVTPAALGSTLRVRIGYDGATLADDRIEVSGERLRRRLPVAPAVPGGDAADWQGVAVWSPESPALHDVRLELVGPDGAVVDAVDSYFGMRSVEVRDGRFLLNGRPYYQRLVLDQGYFPGGGLTAPTDDALRADIELAKELGFNGARKHQKVEDPRWLYWADRLGFLVWGEMANNYAFSSEGVGRLTSEWQAVVERDANHPSIVTWVPMNESWGVPELAGDPRQRALLATLYHLTKALDPTRPVVSNDGWEHAETDLCTVHDYGDAAALRQHYSDLPAALAAEPAGRPLYTRGHHHGAQPVLVTEFGGIALLGPEDVWGYHTVADGDELAARYDELIAAVVASPVVAGFCYTQLTDVEQEANGLLTFDRKPKADPALIRRATGQAPTDSRSNAPTGAAGGEGKVDK